MSESFDDVRMFAQTIVTDCDLPLLNRMKMAHEREIAELKVAHERELEQRMREQYARGHEDGRRSMDAEHYAVALRLMHLTFDEDSHGNLSQIARAVWHSDFGWTQGACRALRDELVRQMGGVHDEHLPNICRTSGEPDENGENCETADSNTVESSKYAENYKSGHITDELREWANENTIKDMVLTTYPEQHGVHGILEQLIAIADRIDEQEHKLRKQRDGFRRGMVAAQDLLEKRTDERDELQAKMEEYERRDTPEDIVRDIHLGKVTDSEAVERIKALYG